MNARRKRRRNLELWKARRFTGIDLASGPDSSVLAVYRFPDFAEAFRGFAVACVIATGVSRDAWESARVNFQFLIKPRPTMLDEFIAEIRATQTDPDLLVFADWLEKKGVALDDVLEKAIEKRDVRFAAFRAEWEKRLFGVPADKVAGGDAKDRLDAYVLAVKNGLLTVEEARELMGRSAGMK